MQEGYDLPRIRHGQEKAPPVANGKIGRYQNHAGHPVQHARQAGAIGRQRAAGGRADDDHLFTDAPADGDGFRKIVQPVADGGLRHGRFVAAVPGQPRIEEVGAEFPGNHVRHGTQLGLAGRETMDIDDGHRRPGARCRIGPDDLLGRIGAKVGYVGLARRQPSRYVGADIPGGKRGCPRHGLARAECPERGRAEDDCRNGNGRQGKSASDGVRSDHGSVILYRT